MRTFLLILFLFSSHQAAISQSHGFPFGQVTYRELELKKYDQDTVALALILDEFGEAYVDNYNNHNIIFEYHAKIKILKKAGVSYGDFEIPLGKSPSKSGMTLPQGGGQFVLDFQNGSNKLSMNNSLFISRSIFASQEYQHLNDLFNHVVAAQQTELVFKKKK